MEKYDSLLWKKYGSLLWKKRWIWTIRRDSLEMKYLWLCKLYPWKWKVVFIVVFHIDPDKGEIFMFTVESPLAVTFPQKTPSYNSHLPDSLKCCWKEVALYLLQTCLVGTHWYVLVQKKISIIIYLIWRKWNLYKCSSKYLDSCKCPEISNTLFHRFFLASILLFMQFFLKIFSGMANNVDLHSNIFPYSS